MPKKYVRKTNHPTTGRPRKELDVELFKKLCVLHCTEEEIAGILEMTADTLDERIKERWNAPFSAVFKRFSAPGKVSLRRTQFKMAETNPAMAIWMGKMHLGQVDRSQIEQRVNTNASAGNLDLSKLSVEKLRLMNELLKEASRSEHEAEK